MGVFKYFKDFELFYEKCFAHLTGGYSAERYNLLNPYFLPFYLINKNVKTLGASLSGVLLDAGCGSKPYLRHLQSQTHRYIGIELPQTYNTSESSNEFLGTEQPDIWGDCAKLPLKNASIDSVFSCMVLEHIPEPCLYLSEIHRVVKPGGQLLITIPQSYPLHHNTHDFYRFTILGITHLLNKHGFEVVSVRNNGGFFLHMAEMALHYLNRRMFRNVPGRILKAIGGIAKVVCTPLLFLINVITNLIALAVNTIDMESTVTTSMTVLAKKRQ